MHWSRPPFHKDGNLDYISSTQAGPLGLSISYPWALPGVSHLKINMYTAKQKRTKKLIYSREDSLVVRCFQWNPCSILAGQDCSLALTHASRAPYWATTIPESVVFYFAWNYFFGILQTALCPFDISIHWVFKKVNKLMIAHPSFLCIYRVKTLGHFMKKPSMCQAWHSLWWKC